MPRVDLRVLVAHHPPPRPRPAPRDRPAVGHHDRVHRYLGAQRDQRISTSRFPTPSSPPGRPRPTPTSARSIGTSPTTPGSSSATYTPTIRRDTPLRPDVDQVAHRARPFWFAPSRSTDWLRRISRWAASTSWRRRRGPALPGFWRAGSRQSPTSTPAPTTRSTPGPRVVPVAVGAARAGARDERDSDATASERTSPAVACS